MIDVHPNRLPKIRLKHMIHESLESGRCICETKRHYPVGKTSPRRNEGCLLLVLLCNVDLEIVGVAVTYRVPLMAYYSIQNLILKRKRKVLLLRCSIQGFVIYANLPLAILLRGHHHWGYPF